MSLSKRRRSPAVSTEIENDAARTAFQRAFESRFAPLSPTHAESSESSSNETDHSISEAESDWHGLSDDEKVQVVRHTDVRVEQQRLNNVSSAVE